jgi:preprotein translocase subunit SecG
MNNKLYFSIIFVIIFLFITIYFSYFSKRQNEKIKKYPYKRKNAMKSEEIEKILKEINNSL